MKTLFSTAFMGLMLLAFAETQKPVTEKLEARPVSCTQIYNDTIPKRDSMPRKDSMRKDRKTKREKRDTLMVL